MNRNTLAQKHSLGKEAVFRSKVFVLTAIRCLKNLASPTRKFRATGQLRGAPVIAASASALWNLTDTADNWILTAGKVENLRIAAQKLHGLEIKANEVFSFWRHIGNPNIGQGYVVGREIREGCIVPTVAGGLCQLSNALYDAALQAQFQIIERHKHTQVIPGSLAEQDRDATVKWNYLDLRFRASVDFRLEVDVEAAQLVVSFRSLQQPQAAAALPQMAPAPPSQLKDCYSCGNLACVKHPAPKTTPRRAAGTTYILDEHWPEYDAYLQSAATAAEHFIIPLARHRFLNTERYSWAAAGLGRVSTTPWQAAYRALKLRTAARNKNNVFELGLALDRRIARAAARQIPLAATHVVVAQNLLPFVYETGALGGRTFDVLMTRLPLEKLHERLDYAHAVHPASPTLNDFRAPQRLVELENAALRRAGKIITAHTEIAGLFPGRAHRLSWQAPVARQQGARGNKVLFPASAVGRKGAYEIRRLATELNLALVVSGRPIEDAGFWQGLPVERFDGNFSQIGLIVYPTYVEHQPRQLLKALATGLPLITTPACGLDRSEQVTIVGVNSYAELKSAVCARLHSQNQA